MNLRDMTEADFDEALVAPRENRIPRMFKGLDYQGRHPEAAEAATDLGADDPPKEPLTRSEVLLLIAIWCVSAGVVLYLAALARGWIS